MANVKGDLSSFLKLPFLFKSFFQHYISGFAVWRVDGQMTCHIETLPRKTGRGQMTVPPNSMTKLGGHHVFLFLIYAFPFEYQPQTPYVCGLYSKGKA